MSGKLPNCENCKHSADCNYKDDPEFLEDIRVYCDDWEREVQNETGNA